MLWKWLSDPANLTAIATLVIAIFTVVLAIVSYYQARLTRQTIDLARDEFSATHRPRLFVQSVIVRSYGRGEPNETPARMIFHMINGGDARCRLLDWEATIYFQTDEAMFQPKFGATLYNTDKEKYVLAPGEAGTLEVEQRHDSLGVGQFDVGLARLFVLGRLTYQGDDGISRAPGFCREYSRDDGMWHIMKDSEYEYAY